LHEESFLKLRDLLSVLPEYQAMSRAGGGDSVADASLVTQDARRMQIGGVFVAIPGHHVDGHRFIPQAVQAGAAALVVEKSDLIPENFSGVVVTVKNAREALDLLASQFYAHPSKEMFCIGVTGTNGKTSTTYMFEAVMTHLGFPCGVLGTINHHLGDQVWPSEVTTPDPVALQSRLREMRDAGARAVAMEVSSHALSQHRADGVHFNTVLFTNLTRDHLDYHKDMKEYFLAKQRLFTDLLWKTSKHPSFAIVNTDDPWGARLRVAAKAALWTYGQKKTCDFHFEILKMDFMRTDFQMTTPFGTFKSFVPLCGLHNMYNVTGVVAATASIAIPPNYALDALTKFTGVPGRLQAVPNARALNVFVDYAHSPDALENVLKALRRVREDVGSHSHIWTIFGCGGDRDKGKRPLMAETAATLSDYVMVTSDNPRTEEPMAIIADILAGFSVEDRRHKVSVESDRKKAIAQVFKRAKPHDVILIAGKGHEDYQMIGTEKIHFNDFEVAEELLS
jgi:UDP-N-acetylmuramoyl-L-alanyl-D-glutamate--2,6-diaminopimelate ligase